MKDTSATITCNYKGPFSYPRNGPIYCIIPQNSDGAVGLFYYYLLCFNGCRPKFEANAINKVNIVCSASVHWSDEMKIYLSSDVNFLVYDYQSSQVYWSELILLFTLQMDLLLLLINNIIRCSLEEEIYII